MKITALYKQYYQQVSQVSLETTTPTKVKLDHDLFTRYYLVVLNDTPVLDKPSAVLVTTDFSRLLVETLIGKCNTFTDIEAALTDVLVTSYATTFPDFDKPTKALITTQLLPNELYELSFTSLLTPEQRNISRYRWRLPDLCISKTTTANKTDFSKCLCTVNGLVAKPVLYNDELFFRDGVRFMHDTTYDHEPDITLLDFTELGGFTIVPFSDCTFKTKTHNTVKLHDTDVEFYLPDTVDLTNTTVFPVILNTMFWPKDIRVTSKRSILVSPQKLPLHMAMLKRQYRQCEFVPDSSLLVSDYTLAEYISVDMHKPTTHDAFFVVVHDPNILIRQTHVCSYTDTIGVSTKDINGILFDATTQSFMDATKVRYYTTTDWYTNDIPHITRYPNGLYNKQYATEETRCLHTPEHFTDYHDSDLYVVNIIAV